MLNGESLVGQPSFRIMQKGVARTFQTIRLYGDLPVIENVELGQPVSRGLRAGVGDAAAGRATIKVSSTSARGRWTCWIGSASRIGRGRTASNLPYGEQRRLEICRALASDPQLLLLDEPAAGMNPQEVEELMELITWVHEHFKLTILLIEHHMRVVMGICPHIVVMDFGEVIARGNPQEIQTNPRVIEAYLGTDEDEEAA